jgi:hypothetical protein
MVRSLTTTMKAFEKADRSIHYTKCRYQQMSFVVQFAFTMKLCEQIDVTKVQIIRNVVINKCRLLSILR